MYVSAAPPLTRQQVQAVETEVTLIGVLVKNGRRKLHERDLGIVQGSMMVSRKHRKAQRLKSLLELLSEFQEVAHAHTRLGECLGLELYCEAIDQYTALREALAADKFKKFPGLAGLKDGLGQHLALVQQKLSDGLRVAAVSSEFDAERYEEILKAYSMLSSDQALRRVGGSRGLSPILVYPLLFAVPLRHPTNAVQHSLSLSLFPKAFDDVDSKSGGAGGSGGQDHEERCSE